MGWEQKATKRSSGNKHTKTGAEPPAAATCVAAAGIVTRRVIVSVTERGSASCVVVPAARTGQSVGGGSQGSSARLLSPANGSQEPSLRMLSLAGGSQGPLLVLPSPVSSRWSATQPRVLFTLLSLPPSSSSAVLCLFLASLFLSLSLLLQLSL